MVDGTGHKMRSKFSFLFVLSDEFYVNFTEIPPAVFTNCICRINSDHREYPNEFKHTLKQKSLFAISNFPSLPFVNCNIHVILFLLRLSNKSFQCHFMMSHFNVRFFNHCFKYTVHFSKLKKKTT